MTRTFITLILTSILVACSTAPEEPDPAPMAPVPYGEDLPGPLEEEELIREEERWIPQPEALPPWEELPFDEPLARLSPLQSLTFHRAIATRMERLDEEYSILDALYADRAVRPEIAQGLGDVASVREEIDAEFEDFLEVSTATLIRRDLFVADVLLRQSRVHAARLVGLHERLQNLQVEIGTYHFDDDRREMADRHFRIARMHEEVAQRLVWFVDS